MLREESASLLPCNAQLQQGFRPEVEMRSAFYLASPSDLALLPHSRSLACSRALAEDSVKR